MGFSVLIDILGSTIIGGILLISMLHLNENSVKNDKLWGNDRILQRDLSSVATLMENDFRKMGYCYNTILDDTLKLIYKADTSDVEFRGDLNSDGVLDVVHYYVGPTSELSGTPNPRDRILYRKINNEPPLMISNNVVSMQLVYLDVFDDTLSQPIADTREIESMQIGIRVEDPAAFNNEYTTAYWQQIRLISRNLYKR
jgi:hypothetical protein